MQIVNDVACEESSTVKLDQLLQQIIEGVYSDIQPDVISCLLEKSASTFDDSFTYSIVSEKPMCLDDDGIERSYGECWTKINDACQICTCYDMQNVQCSARQCDMEPICKENERRELQADDGCCKSFRCVESKFGFF